MKIIEAAIVGLPVKDVRDLMLHFRKYIVSEETTQQYFDALLWRKAVDAAAEIDSQIPRSLRGRADDTSSRKQYSQIWGIKFKPMSRRETKAIFASLLAEGWIEPKIEPDNKFDRAKFDITEKGVQLSVKRLVPRIDRAKADKIIGEMIARIEEINSDPLLLDYVTKVVAFGSYTTDSNDLGDIDLHVTIKRRIENYEKHKLAVKIFNEASGKQFSSYLDELFYHQIFIKQRIKKRSPYISLHGESDLQLATSSKVLYEFFPPTEST